MADKVLVFDNVLSANIPMWQCDAEEAIRYAGAHFSLATTPKVTKIIPVKNPGGRGW